MEEFISFLTEYYYIFIILAVILIFALIGYFIDLKHPDENGKNGDELSDAELLKRQISERGNTTIGSFMNKQAGDNANTVNDSNGTVITTSSAVESLDMDTNINKPL